MRIFLTGGTGYLGQRILKALNHDPDIEITALYRHAIPKDVSNLERVVWRHGDMSDIGLHRSFFKEVDLFIHMAGLFEPGLLTRPAEIEREVVTNLSLLLPMLETENVKTFVYTGSLAALGDTGNLAWDEDYTRPKKFSCMFEECHWRALKLVRELKGRVNYLTALAGPTFGPQDPGWLWRIVRSIVRKESRNVIAPWHFLSPIHIDDLAEGFLQMLLKGVDNNEYILSGEPVEMMNLIYLLSSITGQPAPKGKVSPIGAFFVPFFNKIWNRERVRYLRKASFAYTPAKAKRVLRWSNGILQDRLRQALEDEELIPKR